MVKVVCNLQYYPIYKRNRLDNRNKAGKIGNGLIICLSGPLNYFNAKALIPDLKSDCALNGIILLVLRRVLVG